MVYTIPRAERPLFISVLLGLTFGLHIVSILLLVPGGIIWIVIMAYTYGPESEWWYFTGIMMFGSVLTSFPFSFIVCRVRLRTIAISHIVLESAYFVLLLAAAVVSVAVFSYLDDLDLIMHPFITPATSFVGFSFCRLILTFIVVFFHRRLIHKTEAYYGIQDLDGAGAQPTGPLMRKNDELVRGRLLRLLEDEDEFRKQIADAEVPASMRVASSALGEETDSSEDLVDEVIDVEEFEGMGDDDVDLVDEDEDLIDELVMEYDEDYAGDIVEGVLDDVDVDGGLDEEDDFFVEHDVGDDFEGH